MTDTQVREWDDWQIAWRGESPEATARTATPVAELQRRLVRHRRAAWTYTALDVCAGTVLCGIGVYALNRSPTLPVCVWAISLFAFTVSACTWAIWNRRDALQVLAHPTTDFVAALRVRLDRRERVPRFLMRFAAAEIAFGLVFHAIWSPEAILRVAKVYGVIALGLAMWWRWYRRRLRRERTQLDALCREPLRAAGSSEPDQG
jgi:hypothetical protein